MFLKGLLNKRQIEIVERDIYNKNEYGVDYYDTWAYGNDLTDELEIEGEFFSSTYSLEDFK